MNLVPATLKLPSKHHVHGNFCRSANNILFPFFQSNPKEIIVIEESISVPIKITEKSFKLYLKIYRKLSCKLYAFKLTSSLPNVPERSSICQWSQQVINSLFKESFTELQKYPHLPEPSPKYTWTTHSAFKFKNVIKLQHSNINHYYCKEVTTTGVNNIQLIYCSPKSVGQLNSSSWISARRKQYTLVSNG